MHSLKLDIPAGPVTQTLQAGLALARYLGIEEELPKIIPLANGSRLTLSSKKDVYYVTTLRTCSCRAGAFGKICKHRRDASEAARAHGTGYQREVDDASRI